MKESKLQPEVIHKSIDVIERLGKRYTSPEYAFMTQVRNGTGYEKQARTADALSMSLWPSRGLHLIGFEVKISRSDWVKELRQPDKAEAIASYCDYWYLAVGDKNIVQEGELPKTWGLLVPDKKFGMREVISPKLMKAKTMDRITLAGLMRNVSDKMIAKELIESQEKRSFDRGKDWAKHSLERLEKDKQELQNKLDEFEKASGVRIGHWDNPTEIGLAVKMVLNGKDKKAAQRLKSIANDAQKIVDYCNGAESLF